MSALKIIFFIYASSIQHIQRASTVNRPWTPQKVQSVHCGKELNALYPNAPTAHKDRRLDGGYKNYK